MVAFSAKAEMVTECSASACSALLRCSQKSPISKTLADPFPKLLNEQHLLGLFGKSIFLVSHLTLTVCASIWRKKPCTWHIYSCYVAVFCSHLCAQVHQSFRNFSPCVNTYQ